MSKHIAAALVAASLIALSAPAFADGYYWHYYDGNGFYRLCYTEVVGGYSSWACN
jgi:hypothetical protein